MDLHRFWSHLRPMVNNRRQAATIVRISTVPSTDGSHHTTPCRLSTKPLTMDIQTRTDTHRITSMPPICTTRHLQCLAHTARAPSTTIMAGYDKRCGRSSSRLMLRLPHTNGKELRHQSPFKVTDHQQPTGQEVQTEAETRHPLTQLRFHRRCRSSWPGVIPQIHLRLHSARSSFSEVVRRFIDSEEFHHRLSIPPFHQIIPLTFHLFRPASSKRSPVA